MTEKDTLASLFDDAVIQHRAGALDEAARLYAAALAIDPDHAPSLYMAGLLAYQRGDARGGLQLFERGLTGGHRTPLTPHHYGAILLGAGRAAAAADQFRIALQDAPEDTDTLFNLGLAERQAGRAADAAATLGRVVQAWPDRALALFEWAGALQDTGMAAEAAEALRRVLAIEPVHIEALNNLGVMLLRLEDIAGASAAWRQVLALDALHNAAHRNLGDLLMETEGREAALAAPRATVANHPSDARAWLLLGQRVERLTAAGGDLTEAVEALQNAIARDPQLAAGHAALGQLQQRQGNPAAAIPLYARAVELQPDNKLYRVAQGLAALQAGDVPIAITALEAALAVDPYDQEALAYVDLAYRASGQIDKSTYLTDLSRVIAVRQMATPAGYVSLAAFNDVLADTLRRAARQYAPARQSIRGGTQTKQELFHLSEPVLQDFKRALDAEIEAYLAARAPDAAHPFFGAPLPRPLRYRSWSVVLTKQGYHVPHIHPEGAISGVYYVAVPPLDSVNNEGALELGRHGMKIGANMPAPSPRFVAPRPGQLVLFPSYLWHGTVPFAGEGERIVLAFDILATNARA